MGTEIERKFLADGDAVKEITKDYHALLVTQGYIMEDEETNTVLRIRLSAYGTNEPRTGHLTVKRGIDSMSRDEFEYEIPAKDAEFMLTNMCPRAITKIRRIISYRDSLEMNWEIDFFMNNELSDLVIAEIELPSKDTEIVLPEWIIEEVTDDPQYLNSNLIKRINT